MAQADQNRVPGLREVKVDERDPDYCNEVIETENDEHLLLRCQYSATPHSVHKYERDEPYVYIEWGRTLRPVVKTADPTSGEPT